VLAKSEWGTLKPRLALAIRLKQRKSQLVVMSDRGAATVSVSLYGIVAGGLRVLPFETGESAGTELTLNGSVDTWTGVSCKLGGPLTVIGFAAFGKHSFYSKQVYRLTGRWLRRRWQRTARRDKPPRWWKAETGKPNFAGCIVAGSAARLG